MRCACDCHEGQWPWVERRKQPRSLFTSYLLATAGYFGGFPTGASKASLQADDEQNQKPDETALGSELSQRPSPLTPPTQQSASVDVLVVDDDSGVRSTCAAILRGAGYVVAEAEDGLEALHLLHDLEVGMVLLDIRMPRMDGIALLEALDQHPPVVICSAFSLDETARRRVGAKVTSELQKPVEPSRLLSVVAATLGPR